MGYENTYLVFLKFSFIVEKLKLFALYVTNSGVTMKKVVIFDIMIQFYGKSIAYSESV
jgi:hypothetical protein